MIDVSKQDWKLFRQMLPVWQETYMAKLLEEYKRLLDGSEKASERFWKLEERIKADKRCPGVICRLEKKEMVYTIVQLIHDEAIAVKDLECFSEALQSRVLYLLGITND